MRYVPKLPTENVNISKTHPLKEFFKLFIGLLVILICLYIILGLLVDFVATALPEDIEDSLGRFYKPLWEGKSIEAPEVTSIQELLDSLSAQLNPPKSYHVHIIPSKQSNALALPGKRIIIFSSLLSELDSENELAFVLGHELGHFQNKDHLRALGRGLVLFVFSNIFFGQDNALYRIIGDSLRNTEMKFSQRQETAADFFALKLVVGRYGHATGVVSFLEKIKNKRAGAEWLDFFRSHPHPAARIRAIEKIIAQEGYRSHPPRTLDARLKALAAQPASTATVDKNNN